MIINLDHEAQIDLDQLRDEVRAALRKDVNIKILSEPATQTNIDPQGRETVQYLGYSIKIKDDLLQDEALQVRDLIKAHRPPSRVKKVKKDSLEDIIKRVEAIELQLEISEGVK